LADEAYEHVLFDGHQHISPASLGYDRVISIFSFSKSYAMSGLRLGYLAVKDPLLLERMTKLLRCTINGVNSATQWAGVAALTGPQEATKKMAQEYQRRRDLLWEGLQACGALHPVKPQGAFYLGARIDEAWRDSQGRRSGWAMTEELIAKGGIGSAPGEVFGPASGGHTRFAFACATEQVAQAAQVLPQLLP
jgi:aspartate aminotransferase